jgi:hypothetical protein
MKNNFLKIVMFLIFDLDFQTPISLENAINKAFSNNLNIKSGELKINYQETKRFCRYNRPFEYFCRSRTN